MEKENKRYSLDEIDDIENIDDLDELEDIDDFDLDEIDDIYDFDSELDEIDDYEDTGIEEKENKIDDNDDVIDEDEIIIEEKKEQENTIEEEDTSIEEVKEKKETSLSDESNENTTIDNNNNKIKLAIGIIVGAIIIVIILLLLKGCNSNYTITFDSNGGTQVNKQEIEKNGLVSKPSDPTRDGYTFEGWYFEGEKYDFNTKVTGDIKLEARWTSGNANAVKSITLDQTNVTIAPNNSILLVSIIEPNDAKDQTVEWTSSDESVATVDSNGNVTALKEGTAIITVTTNDGGYKAACAVTVSADVVSVTGVTLNTNELQLNTGDKAALKATITPDNATNKGIVWTSSNTKVAKVVNGNVTAIGNGSAIITATTKDGEYKATVNVTVKNVAVTNITINPTKLTMFKGQIKTLEYQVEPTNATNKNVTWTSSNPSVAKVDKNGKVTATGIGTSTISVTTKDGNKKAICSLTVNRPIESIKIREPKDILYEGKTIELTYMFYPTAVTDSTTYWSSSDESIATVDKNGVVTGKKAGKVNITVKSIEGPSDTIELTVQDRIPVTGIEIDETEIKMVSGDEKKLTTIITPNDATFKDVTWTSSDSRIVSVKKDGTIKAIKPGIATITVASVDNPNITDSVKVVVEETTITLEGNAGIYNGTTHKLSIGERLNFKIKTNNDNVKLSYSITDWSTSEDSKGVILTSQSDLTTVLKEIKNGSLVTLIGNNIKPEDKIKFTVSSSDGASATIIIESR